MPYGSLLDSPGFGAFRDRGTTRRPTIPRLGSGRRVSIRLAVKRAVTAGGHPDSRLSSRYDRAQGQTAHQVVNPLERRGASIEVPEGLSVRLLELAQESQGTPPEPDPVPPRIERRQGRVLPRHEDDTPTAESDLLQRPGRRIHRRLDEHPDRREHPSDDVGVQACGLDRGHMMQEDPASVEEEDLARTGGTAQGRDDGTGREE